MNKTCKTYLSEVKALFPIWGKDERTYISKFKETLLDCIGDEAAITKEDLYRELGFPKDVVDSYYLNADIGDIIKRIRISRYIRNSIFIILFCAIIFSFAVTFNMYKSYKMFDRMEAVITEDVVEDYTEEVIDGEMIIE